MLTTDDRLHELQPGNYFRRTKTDKKYKDLLIKGSIALLTKVDLEDQDVHFLVVGSSEVYGYQSDKGICTFTNSIAGFLAEYELEPNGRSIMDQALRESMLLAKSVADEITSEAQSLSGIEAAFKPKALVGVDVEAAPEDTIPIQGNTGEIIKSEALIRHEGLTGMLEQAHEWIGNIADRRNNISAKKLELDNLKRNAEALLKEQKKYMEALTGFKDIADAIEEVIGNLNLYLGSGEEILQLRNGKPADRSIPLSIRQLVLFMDEECALATEDGGIDAYTIEQFDEWLLADEKNLNQVLPELKGVVCLKPRRNMKEYSEDANQNAILNQANKETYVLIRNGENLYRVCPPWGVRKYFFPTKDEFKDALTSEQRLHKETAEKKGLDVSNWTDSDDVFGRYYRLPIENVNSHDFKEAKKKLDKEMAYYSKALIMLQGLVDRTGIFPEFQEIGLNLIDVSQWTDYLRFVHDADPAFLLTAGKETFEQFTKRVNSDLQIGDRIIGMFHKLVKDSLKKRGEWGDSYPSRLTPKKASWPDDFGLYTIEGRSQEYGWKIGYERTDEIRRGRWDKCDCDRQGEPHACVPKTRAACQISESDEYIFAFDKIGLEEIDYFLNDRLSRSDYLRMFELMKRVRNMKRVEREAEEPFITLAIGEAMKLVPDLTEPEIRPQVIKAMQWWKYKNKVHRAVTDDFGKALKAVTNQWFAMYHTAQEVNGHQATIDALKTDKTMAIFIRKTYVIVVDRVNDDKIFVHRKNYYRTKSGFTIYDEKPFTTVGNWYMGWESIYETPEWEAWPKGARSKRDFLNPTEYAKLFREVYKPITDGITAAMARAVGKTIYDQKSYRSTTTPAEVISVDLVGVELTTERHLRFYYQGVFKGEEGRRRYHFSKGIKWKRKDGIPIYVDEYGRHEISFNWPTKGLGVKYEFIKKTLSKSWDPEKDSSFFTYLDTEKIAKWAKLENSQKAKKERERDRQQIGRNFGHKIIEHANEAAEEQAKKRYLANFGDPLNWDNFKGNAKRAGIEKWDIDDIDNFVKSLSDMLGSKKIAEDALDDKTISEVIDMVKEHDEVNDEEIKKLGEIIDLDAIIPFKIEVEKPEELDEEEEIEEEQGGMEWEHPE